MHPRRVVRPVALLAVVLACLPACSRPRTTDARATPAPSAPAAPQPNPDEARAAPAIEHGSRKLLQLDAPVFVDGRAVAVLRYGDLPPIAREELAGGTPSFRLADYLEAVGVPLARVRSVHLHGNSDRIASVEGGELARDRARFTFTFSSGTTGTPVQRWDTEGLANEFVVHEIRKVSVFVDKAPAPIHPRSRCHLDAEGQCTKEVPYAQAEPPKGTRVVVDGRMIGAVKRRQIGDDVVLARTDAETTFSVARLARSFGLSAGPVEAVEIVAGDEVVARATGEQWARLSGTLAFTLPRHEHGKIRVRIPAELQADDAEPRERDALVSAVVVYRKTRPAPRPLVHVSDDTDRAVRLASSDATEADLAPRALGE